MRLASWFSFPNCVCSNLTTVILKCNTRKFVLIFLLFFAKFTFSEQAENNSQLPSLQKIGDAKFRFGGVIIDQRNRIIEFNATCNQRNGLIEYALVHESGKTHESLFRTTIRPQILHACFLLLKHPAETRFFKNLWSDNPKKLNFDKNRINTEVVWDQNGTILSKSLEDLALNTKNNEVLIKGALIFTGSKKIEGTYLAELSGSMVAVYADEEAIVNSSHHDSNNDDVWIANEKEMPALELPVVIRFLLPKSD